MRTWIAWVMNGNSFILLWLFDQVNPHLSFFTSIMLLTFFPVPSSLRALVSCPPPPPNTDTFPSLILFPGCTATAEPISESFWMSCWIWKLREKNNVFHWLCGVNIYEGASEEAKEEAGVRQPVMAADRGSFSGTSLAASSIPAERGTREWHSGSIFAWATHTHTQSCSRFCASFLFLPSPADQSQLQKKIIIIKKSLDVVQLQQTIRP